MPDPSVTIGSQRGGVAYKYGTFLKTRMQKDSAPLQVEFEEKNSKLTAHNVSNRRVGRKRLSLLGRLRKLHLPDKIPEEIEPRASSMLKFRVEENVSPESMGIYVLTFHKFVP